ncbi:MAG: hypothetical protein ACI31F_08350 [Muribaculaceae bacterium]
MTKSGNYLSQYIDLQKLRSGIHADIVFSTSIEDSSFMIPPMLLITFVENAFKYGISSDASCFVYISLSQYGNNLIFKTENSISGRIQKGSGKGIENCHKRLSLLYPGKYHLNYGTKYNNTFGLQLEITNE